MSSMRRRPSVQRRFSNDLAADFGRIEQLRALQRQLSVIIQDQDPGIAGDGDDSTLDSVGDSWTKDSWASEPRGRGPSLSQPLPRHIDASERPASASLTRGGGRNGTGDIDVEAGIPAPVDDQPLPVTYRQDESGYRAGSSSRMPRRGSSTRTLLMGNTDPGNSTRTLLMGNTNAAPGSPEQSHQINNPHPAAPAPGADRDSNSDSDSDTGKDSSKAGSLGSISGSIRSLRSLRRRGQRAKEAGLWASATAKKRVIRLSSDPGRRLRKLSSSERGGNRSGKSWRFSGQGQKRDLDETVRGLHAYDFLERDDEDATARRGLLAGGRWWHAVFGASLVSVLACIITLWAPYPTGARMPSAMVAATPWSDGCQGLESCICPRETICADDILSEVLLTIARSTAWFDYPLYMVLFLSKASNLNNFLQRTMLRCWMNFSDYHRVHSLFGIIVGIESTSHSFFHILRWARRKNDILLLWNTRTGITGLIAIILVPFIVLPMTVPYFKQRMSYEWRKGLHYVSILWGVALMFHAPERIVFLVGVPLFVYITDKAVKIFFKTHLVESAHFQRLGDTALVVSFENPPGFGRQNSAYVYLMLPWLSKSQFHAFTVFPCTKPGHYSICIYKSGDWTGELMKIITAPTHKPAFLSGPFLSPFSSPAMDSEFLVAVASGIGVTPAISLIKQYTGTSRRLNLVWVCRDPGLVEHFLQNVEFAPDGYTLIYYTGKERSLILKDDLPSNVFVFNGRPNLERTISGIVISIATGEGLPEELQKKVVTRTPAEMRSKLLLQKALSIYSIEQLYKYTVKASIYHQKGQEPLDDSTVTYQGVLSTMKHLLGSDGETVADKITRNFEEIDSNGDGRIDRENFETFVELMLTEEDSQEKVSMATIEKGLQQQSRLGDMFRQQSVRGFKCTEAMPKTDQLNDEFGVRRHLQGDGKFQARNWNMLYCGGSQPVLDQLKSFKRKFGIALSVEKFDW